MIDRARGCRVGMLFAGIKRTEGSHPANNIPTWQPRLAKGAVCSQWLRQWWGDSGTIVLSPKNSMRVRKV
jgi:hypothetical protein